MNNAKYAREWPRFDGGIPSAAVTCGSRVAQTMLEGLRAVQRLNTAALFQALPGPGRKGLWMPCRSSFLVEVLVRHQVSVAGSTELVLRHSCSG